jgi:hypothetical protein
MADKKEIDFLIVSELPQVPVRQYTDEEGKEYSLITLTEAVKEILEGMREMKKAGVF